MSIASEIERLQNAKADIKTAIENKGVTVPSNAKLDEYDTYIANIPSGGGGHDWSQIGYQSEPESIDDGFNQAKEIYDNWDATVTNRKEQYMSGANGLYNGNYDFRYFPNVDMSNVTNADRMFSHLATLETISDDFDFKSSMSKERMFEYCHSLRKVNTIYTVSRYMFNYCRDLEVNYATIAAIGQYAFSNITNLTLHEVGINTSSSSANYPKFYYVNGLDIGQITLLTTTSGQKKLKGKFFQNCSNITDGTLHTFLSFLQTLTDQETSYKTLNAMGLTQAQAELCATFTEWTNLVNDGWTTGF